MLELISKYTGISLNLLNNSAFQWALIFFFCYWVKRCWGTLDSEYRDSDENVVIRKYDKRD